jgi:Tfp pilus assembly protein PilN
MAVCAETAMKNTIFSMPRLTTLRFESQLKYSFWGVHPRFLGTICKALALMILSGYLMILAIQVFKSQQTLQLLASQEQEVRQQIIDLTVKQKKQNQLPASALSPVQIRGYNSVIRQLNLPWTNLFEDLEAMTPVDVALISIEPDGQRSTVKLVAEAKTLVTLLDYTSKLQQNGVFGRLTYSKHETNEQDANKPVRLSFELELRPSPLATSKTSINGQKLKVGLP